MTTDPDDILIDVSRLIWRLWRGRLSTGIDRVCIEYLAYFAARARAVVQFKGRIFVLSRRASRRLISLILDRPHLIRPRLVAASTRLLLSARRTAPRPGMLYLNVGHTGLDARPLANWVAANAIVAVYLVHDLIPITHPQFCRAGEAAKHRKRMKNALATATGIIGNSQATLEELRKFASECQLAMPPALAACINGHSPAPDIPGKKFDRAHFVTVGTIEGRKNHLLLLQVWRTLVEKMGRRAPILLIIGQRGWEADATITILDNAPDLREHVRELSECPDRELAALVKGARALLMPSFAEGFGLPIAEALQLGTPVIASDLAVYHEVFGNIPTYLSPFDPEPWGAAIEAFMADAPERKRQLRAVQEYTPPNWPAHFSAVESWLDELRTQHLIA